MHDLYVRIHLKLIEKIVDISTYKYCQIQVAGNSKNYKDLVPIGNCAYGSYTLWLFKIIRDYATKHFHNNQ